MYGITPHCANRRLYERFKNTRRKFSDAFGSGPLSAHKAYSKKGGLTIANPNDSVMEIFEVTGFKEILNIK